MSLGHGAKIVRDGLKIVFDSSRLNPGGITGTNYTGKTISIIDPISNLSFSLPNGVYATGRSYFTCYAHTYPESSYGSRQGITDGIDNTTSGKRYDMSRDLGLFAFDEDTNSWVPDSYFNGERINGHCYDTYDGAPAQHATFQADFDNIAFYYPNATFIAIGSHAAENNDNDAGTLSRLQSIGLPNSHIGSARPEYICIGKINKPNTWEYVRENISSASAHMNIGLPLIPSRSGFYFNGTSQYATVNVSQQELLNINNQITFSAWVNPSSVANYKGVFGRHYAYQGISGFQCISGSIYFSIGTGSSWVDTSCPITVNEWCMLTGIINNSTKTIKLYKNGVLQSSASFGSFVTYGNLELGRAYNNTDRYWQGEIANFLVYTKELTATEVKQNYEAMRGRYQ